MPLVYVGNGSSFASSVPLIDFTSNNEDVEEANYSPGFQTLADQFEYIRTRMPIAYGNSLPETVSTLTMFGQTVTYAHLAFAIVNGTLNNSGGDVGVPGPHGQYQFPASLEGSGGYVDVPNCAAGDQILVHSGLVISNMQTTTGGTPTVFGNYINLLAIDNVAGTPVSNVITGCEFNGIFSSNSRWGVSTPPASFPFMWAGLWTVVNAGTTRCELAFEGPLLSQIEANSISIRATRFPAR